MQEIELSVDDRLELAPGVTLTLVAVERPRRGQHRQPRALLGVQAPPNVSVERVTAEGELERIDVPCGRKPPPNRWAQKTV